MKHKTILHHIKHHVKHAHHLANKHRHIFLNTIHILLLIGCFSYYNIDSQMFAQEIGLESQQEMEQEITGEIAPENTIPQTMEKEIITEEPVIIAEETTIITGENTPMTGEENIPETITGEAVIEEIIINTGITTNIQTMTGIETMTGEEANTGIETIVEPIPEQEITSPAEITGLISRWDADATYSLILSGEQVLSRKDKTNNGKRAHSNSFEQTPIYQTSIVNNHAAIFFDEQNDSLETNVTLNKGYTIVIVANQQVKKPNYANILGSENRKIGYINSALFYGTSGQINTDFSRPSTDFNIITINATGDTTNIFINNKNITNQSGRNTHLGKLILGQRYIGSEDALGGYIAEILVFDTILTEKENNYLQKYLYNKYSPFICTAIPSNNIVQTGFITSLPIETGIIPEIISGKDTLHTSLEISNEPTLLYTEPETITTTGDIITEEITTPMVLQSTNELSGAIAEIHIPENTNFTTQDGTEYTGEIQAPEFISTTVADEIQDQQIIASIQVGNPEEQINMDQHAKILMPAPDRQEGEFVFVNYSHDGTIWTTSESTPVFMINNEPYVEFSTNHFTIFSLGIWTGSFMINNNTTNTTGYSVCLQTIISGAQQMKLGNTTTQRDSASWIPFSGNYCGRNLTGSDGEKTVYAMFSGNGNIAYIQDTIMLDTNETTITTGIQIYLNGTTSSTLLLDQSGKNRHFSGFNGMNNDNWSGETIFNANGTNHYAELNSGFITTYPFSISLRVKPERVNSTQGLIMFGNSASTTVYRGLQLNSTNAQIIARNGAAARTANGTISMTTEKRYHIVGVFASATRRTIYINAITGGVSTNNVTLSTTNPQRRIARYPGNNTNYFSGGLDEIRIYNKALNYTEISSLYMEQPSMIQKTVYTSSPVIQGSAPDARMQINLIISGTTYPATNNQNGTRSAPIGPLASGTYNITINYTNIYGATGTNTITGGLKVQPMRNINYSPSTNTFGTVIATLTGYQPGTIITNNNGSPQYIFTENNNFTFNIQDSTGNEYQATAQVNWIKKGQLFYSTTGFEEDSIKNDGSISTILTIILTGDSFTENVITGGYITLGNIPTGLSSKLTLSNSKTLLVQLSGNATNHNSTGNINNMTITFITGAFETRTPSDIIDNNETFSVSFLDPYIANGRYPSHDTMIDADTDPADGCADGICQENNYGTTNYLCASDFGSKILLKFNITNIPTGSIITSAKLRLTKYYIGTTTPGTGFKLKRIINNNDWIEGTQNNAKALSGEVNYKMKKRGQENWYNGNIGLVAGVDYATPDISNFTLFTGSTTADVTQEFSLNNNGIDMIQDWLDTPNTNGGIAITDSDMSWICIHSKEYGTIANRPMLSISYAPDTTKPYITNLSPANNESGISLSNSLIITFDNKVKAYTGYSITIKRLSNNTTIETIGATSGNVSITNNIVTINPTNNFGNFTGYYIEIASGAFRDYAGNSFTGFAGSGTRKFTTINTNVIPIVTGATVRNITDTSANFSGNITTTGSSTITERGFYRSTNNGFNDGAGTKISESGSRITTGTFGLTTNTLPAGTQIYVKAFAQNNNGAGYSAQTGFLTKPAQPELLTANNIDNDNFQINWLAGTGTDIYKLYVSTNSLFTTYLTGYGPWTGTSTSKTITGLSRQTTYYYKLVANNAAGDSLTSAIASTTTTLLPAPRIRLQFEESAGSVAQDSTPNNNDGILFGGITQNQTGINGKSYYYDGINDDVSIVDIDYGPSFTYSFWFKVNAIGNDMHLLSHGNDTGTNSINVLLNDSDKTIRTYINGNQSVLNFNSTTYSTVTNGYRHLYTVSVDDNTITTGQKTIKVYIDGVQKGISTAIAAGTFNPTNNITLGRRSTNQSGSFFNGRIDEFKLYNKALSVGEISNMYAALADHIPPTATINYSPNGPSCFSGNVTATLTGYSENITIINNSGSNQYVFSENSGFIFIYQDLAGNTGSTTATVDRICKEPMSIGGTGLTFSGTYYTTDTKTTIEQQFNDSFRVNDPIGADSGYYTTISISNLVGNATTLANTNIEFKANTITTLQGAPNSRVTLSSGVTNYQTFSSPLTYIKRDAGTNNNLKGRYGDTPQLRVTIPAYQPIDTYHATISYTLYEN